MIGDRFSGPRILRIARPEHAHLALDLLVSDARVVGDAAFACDPQLLENLAWLFEGESLRAAERARQILDDPPVLSGLAGAVDGLIDLDDAAFDLRDGAFILFVKTARQHDVGVAGGVVEEEIDRGVELQLLETPRHEVVVGQRHFRIETDRNQSLDLAGVDLAEHLVGVYAGPRQFRFVDPPDAADVTPVLRVRDVAPARKLIALLAVLAPALAVGLADDGAVAAVGTADTPGRKHQIDRAKRVLHAVRVVLDAAGMEQKTRARLRPHFGRLFDRAAGHAGDLGRLFDRPFAAVRRHRVEARRVRGDELLIDPVVLDHDLQHSGEERRIAAGLHGQEQIAGPCDGGQARILDDDPRAMLARLPQIIGGDRRAFGHVRPRDPDHVRADHVGPGIGGAIDAECFLVGGAGADHAEPAVVVDEWRLQAHPRELAEQVRLFRRQTGAAEHADRPRAMVGLQALDLGGRASDRIRITDRRETPVR